MPSDAQQFADSVRHFHTSENAVVRTRVFRLWCRVWPKASAVATAGTISDWSIPGSEGVVTMLHLIGYGILAVSINPLTGSSTSPRDHERLIQAVRFRDNGRPATCAVD